MSDTYPALPVWHAACAQVVVEAAVAIDQGEVERLLSLCTEDTEFEHAGGVARGKAELHQWFAIDRPAQLVRHLCSNFTGRMVAPGVVQATTFFTVYRAPGRPALPAIGTLPLVVGAWQDTLVLAGGEWRIAQRSTRIDFRAG